MPRVEYCDTSCLKIAHIPGHKRYAMNQSSCRDESMQIGARICPYSDSLSIALEQQFVSRPDSKCTPNLTRHRDLTFTGDSWARRFLFSLVLFRLARPRPLLYPGVASFTVCLSAPSTLSESNWVDWDTQFIVVPVANCVLMKNSAP